MTKEELWQTALTEIQLQISKASFVTWFRNTSISLWKEGSVVISVPNGFSKEWLEKKFNKLIFKTLRDISPHIKDVAVLIEPKQAKTKAKPSQPKVFSYKENADQLSFEQLNIDKETNLNPKYTFQNFIVGSSNELAHAAAFSVSQNLGKEYNPLFIYGGVGLGKTHLLHAIGNELKERAGRNIQYLSSEKFTNEFITAVHNQTIKDFREKYRKLDALLIDDIQFIARKERTQEEFFHTFNALHESNKQIVLSSDRHPKSIDSIDERLKSRFEGGMIADIGYPEFETRVAILKEKMKDRGATLPEDVYHYIAENVHTNIRELEGTLNILLANFKIKTPSEITLEKAQGCLRRIIRRPRRVISLKKVLKTVADFYDVTEKEILSQNRKRDISHPRQVLMYLMREEMKNSYPLIGTRLGGRDHTTVIHAYAKISEALRNNNEQLAEEIGLLKQDIYGA